MKTIDILIINSITISAEKLSEDLSRDSTLKIVSLATCAYEARDKIMQHHPDLIICECNLHGKMNGIEFIKKLLPQYHLPVIMTGEAKYEKDAKKTGASAFIERPKSSIITDDKYIKKMMLTAKAVVHGEVLPGDNAVNKMFSSLIAIGASTGGAEAVESIITSLPIIMPPIIIAQHMPPKFTEIFAERLDKFSKLSVIETDTGEILFPGHAYVAKGGFHTRVIKSENFYKIVCSENHEQLLNVPSVDVLFLSVANATKGNSIGAVLTGMGRDGTIGLMEMRETGSRTIAQDEETSVVYGMPKATVESGAAEMSLSLDKIPQKLIELCRA